MISFILLFIGLLLVFVEFFLPGGVMGIVGGVFIFLSIVFFAIQAKSGWSFLLFLLASAVLLYFVIKFALWRIRQNKEGKGFYLNTDQEGYTAANFDKEMIGRRGKAISDLKPAGHILVDGKKFQALSKTGYITRGSDIEVIGGSGAHLVVKIVV